MAIGDVVRRLLTGLLLALAVAGCRLEVVGTVHVHADGAADAALVLAFDAELLAQLGELGVDPLAQVEAALAGSAWQLASETPSVGTLTLRAQREVAAHEVGDLLRELTSALSPTDPALLVDIDVTVDDAGVAVAGAAGLRPPATAGAVLDGQPIGPAGADMRALVESGVRAALTLTLPGQLVEHDADHRTGDRHVGTTLTWELPVGDLRPVTARAVPPGEADVGLGVVVGYVWASTASRVILGAASIGLVAVVWLLVRERRLRRAALRGRVGAPPA